VPRCAVLSCGLTGKRWEPPPLSLACETVQGTESFRGAPRGYGECVFGGVNVWWWRWQPSISRRRYNATEEIAPSCAELLCHQTPVTNRLNNSSFLPRHVAPFGPRHVAPFGVDYGAQGRDLTDSSVAGGCPA
jgi:hypothetical protein